MAAIRQLAEKAVVQRAVESDTTEVQLGELINASGHVQEVERNFGLAHILSMGATAGLVWPALATSIYVALPNGGPPGVIYEFLTAFVAYCFVATSLAELASAIPSSAGVYHWASVTAGRHGRVVGFFAGWFNCAAWTFGLMSLHAIEANLILAMWALGQNNGYVPQSWHIYVTYLALAMVQGLVVVYMNRLLPYISTIGLAALTAGALVTVVCLAVLPSRNGGYASNNFVWRDWLNQTGYTSDGFAFMLGVLNGAFSVGTPDCVSHVAEEIPNPRKNIPRAMLGQYFVGFMSAFPFLVALFYGISDFEQVLNSKLPVPVVQIYLQATGSVGGALGLTLLVLLPVFPSTIGVYTVVSRIIWALARDNATPFSGFLSRIHPRSKNPRRAIFASMLLVALLGLIYLGSPTAFAAFVGSFVVLNCVAYLLVLVPHLASGRRARGPFYVRGWVGHGIGVVGCLWLAVSGVIFCFPAVMPVDARSMNYSCVIVGGFGVLFGLLWLWKSGRGYAGPQVVMQTAEDGKGELV